jgi:hypothetical protein
MCGADGTCQYRATGGQECDQTAQAPCVDGYYCDTSSAKCTLTKGNGASCSEAKECESQLCAAADAGKVCVAPACYSYGPLLPPSGCSFGGRPSAFAMAFVVAALVWAAGRRRRKEDASRQCGQ